MNAYFSYKIIVAVAVAVYTLVFSFTALIPVYSSKGEPKNVSAVMWITPIVGIVLITLFSRWAFFVWFWKDPFLMGYFNWILLATIAVCILINIALGEFISVIEEKGIRSRRFVGAYRLYPYEEIKEYARILRPFCYKNYLYIYYGKTHLAFEIKTSFGGKAFLKKLSEKLSIDYSYFEQQMKGGSLETSNMYCLMMRMENAERKRIREEKNKK